VKLNISGNFPGTA